MAEKTLEERLSELYEKIDHRDQFFDKDLKTLIDGIRDAREHGGTASVDVTPIVGGYKIVITDSDGVEHVATVKDGGDAYEVYKSTVPEGQSPMTKEEWLETLKGADGADGQDGADAVNPFKGYYPSGVSKPATGAVGDYLYAPPSDSQSTATATIWHYDNTQTPSPWTDTGIDVSAVVGVEFDSGQSVPATKIKDENGVEVQGTADVLSAEAGAALNEGKIDKIVYKTITNTLNPESGYPKNCYITTSGSEQSVSGFKVNKYSVTPGDKCLITGSTGTGASSCMAAFYDSEDVLIASSKIHSGEANKTETDYEVTAPDDAAYLKVQAYTATVPNPICKIKELVVDKYNQDIINKVGNPDNLETTNKDTIVDAINEVNGKISDITETHVSKNLFNKDNVINGRAITSAGAVYPVTSWSKCKCSGLIPVEGGKFYYISGGTINNGVNIRCINSNNQSTKVLNPTSGEEGTNWNMPNSGGTTINGQFLTPSTAVYVQFNVATENTDSSETIMLELVGDTYDSDFTPSDYEPYFEPHTVVKPEAISSDDTPIEDSNKPITSGGVHNALKNIDVSRCNLKVLLIGSSHGVNTISMFPVLARKAGVNIVCGNLYTGSATLGLYANNPAIQIPYMATNNIGFGRFAINKGNGWVSQTTTTLSYALSLYDWDVIILQRGATEDYWNAEISGFYKYLINYINEHSKTAPLYYFNSGIADPTSFMNKENVQIPATNLLINTAKQQKQEYGIDIIPTAVAVQYARMTGLLRNTGVTFNTYKDIVADSQHLDTGVGQYITACAVFEKILGDLFDLSVKNVSYFPTYNDVSGNIINIGTTYFTNITEAYSRAAKECAIKAVEDGEYISDHATELSTKYPADYEIPQVSVTNNLTGCTNNNDATQLESNHDVYMAVITPNSGLSIQSISVTVNGVERANVVATSGSNKVIRIGNVDGDIVITATAS